MGELSGLLILLAIAAALLALLLTALLVREAGGRCEDRSGAPFGLDSSSVVAANPHVFDAFASVVRWPTEGHNQ